MKLFLAGGFLGSGKTTAILKCVQYLQQQGKRAAVVTNDQGDQQVDTQWLRSAGVPVAEVANGCFCCNFSQFSESLQLLEARNQPDIIFAEAVGSCTDLAATVINPLLQQTNQQADTVLSVFADANLLIHYLNGSRHYFQEAVSYIYGKQLDEADIIVVNKIDLMEDAQLSLLKQQVAQHYPSKLVCYQNSLDEQSIALWLQALLNYDASAAFRHTPQIDYNMYGAGEAALAWLDETIGIHCDDENAEATGVQFINLLYTKLKAKGYPIGHLKCTIDNGALVRKISYTSTSKNSYTKYQTVNDTDRVVLLINARVETTPEQLRAILLETIDMIELEAGCKIIEDKWAAFKPGFPSPAYRVTA